MTKPLSERARQIRQIIYEYIDERLQLKVAKLSVEDLKYQEEIEKHRPLVWLQSAVNRVSQIQAVTHPLKATYPDAHIRKTTSLYCQPNTLPKFGLVSSAVLGEKFDDDATGSAAALDVYRLLQLPVEGQTLLALCLQADSDMQRALHDDETIAAEWLKALASITQAKSPNVASHSFAKQLYWLEGEDPYVDDQYLILSPLYPSSLVHKVYQQIQHDHFSDEAKEAREARRLNKKHDGSVRFYPNLAVQVIGGSNPQNISSLSSARRGTNYLLASLPPNWQSSKVYFPFGTDSIFSIFERKKGAQYWLKALQDFLSSNPPANVATRRRVQRLVEGLLDELYLFANEYQHIEEAWSADRRCQLPAAQQCWLNPLRALHDQEFAEQWSERSWDHEVEEDFARWLNQKVAEKVQYLGDIEFRHWAREWRRSDYWVHQMSNVVKPIKRQLEKGVTHEA